MPELPEVETIKQELNNTVIGKKIKAVDVFLPKIINVSPPEFKKKLSGTIVKNVERRAKNLIITISRNRRETINLPLQADRVHAKDENLYLLVHLKMTGQLIYIQNNSINIKNKYTHIIFNFTDGSKLLFNDLRQFGYIKLLNDNELSAYLDKQNFGYEPLENNFTSDKLKDLLRGKKGKIKVMLMDQTFLSGIGNLYAAEICFYAKINPARQISTLTDTETENLYLGIKKILTDAIKHKGSSIENYVDIYGKKGGFVPFLKVYNRKGKKCYRCGSIIQAIKLGGRGTYFCHNCQR
ncbi:MAG: bifunctional DNA-formamidopyrimidine glycosylase/DNA-(apurinic or apyrimidinic site) lyase [bacterium]